MQGKYIVDTDTWIEFFHDRHGVKAHLESIPFDDIFVSEITIAELYYGALHGQQQERHLREVDILRQTFTVIPISESLMDYAEIRNELTSHGQTIDHFDILIGATARHYGLQLVTHNSRHFSRMNGVVCLDWFEK